MRIISYIAILGCLFTFSAFHDLSAADGFAPNQPLNISPENEAKEQPLNVTLHTTTFSDRDLNNTQQASHWQIRTSDGNYDNPVWDTTIKPENTINTSGKLVISHKLNEVTLPYGVLKPSTAYLWRVSHQDSDSLWSKSSEETSFSTSPFIVQPYLQNMTQTGVTVMWEDAEKEGRVEYGSDISYGHKELSTVKATEAGTFIHKVTIEGLSPGTLYHYRGVSGSNSGLDAVFRTAPQRDMPFTFSVWSDSQTGPQIFETLLDMMVDRGVDFGVSTGDMASNGGNYEHIHNYHVGPLSKKFAGRLPWFVAWGNHDRADTIIHDYLSLPDDRGTFSFNYGNSHFICMSIYERDVEWLKADLASPEAKQAVYKFFFIHYPPYCIIWIDGDKWLRENVVPVLEENGVDFVFSGHTHDYERGYHNGVYYVVTGGGSWLDIGEPVVGNWDFMQDHMVMDNEFVLISINGKKLSYEAINDEGEIIDAIRIEK